VLTTRAFMVANLGRFNLTRARTVLGGFACRKYPMEDELQPRLAKETLIPMFQADTPSEQQDPLAVNGFGNGFGCYACHGQFGAHAQLFVKFDSQGKWIAAATGVQDPKGELGRAANGLMASHLADKAAAASEQAPMFGRSVANLAEAAKLLASHPLFVECAAAQALRFGLDLDESTSLDSGVLAAIAAAARAGGDPTFGEIVQQVFSHPWVIRSVVSSLRSGGAQ
jgi:hypothetical protein